MKKNHKNAVRAVAMALVAWTGTSVSHAGIVFSSSFDEYAAGTASADEFGADTLGDGWFTSDESGAAGTAPSLVYQSLAGDGYLAMGPYTTIYARKAINAGSIAATDTKVVMTGTYYSGNLINTAGNKLVVLGLDNELDTSGGATFQFSNASGATGWTLGSFVSDKVFNPTAANMKLDFVYTLTQASPTAGVIASLKYQVDGGGFIDVTFNDGLGNYTVTSVNLGSAVDLTAIQSVFSRAANGGGYSDLQIVSIPEPAALGLIVAMGGGLMVARRIFTI